MRTRTNALATSPRDETFPAGKSAALEWVAPQVRASRVPRGITFDAARWRAQRERCVEKIAEAFEGELVAVRSDRLDEDHPGASAAGRYRTCLGVDGADGEAIARAIDAVFASYGAARADDRVLVQRQIAPVAAAVVASTHALPDGAPYYVLSVARTPQSDAVTRGDSDVETWHVARECGAQARLPDDLAACLAAMIELETIAGGVPCEAEMVISGRVPWTLQLRRLPLAIADAAPVVALRRRVEERLARRATPLLGLMPDWNPAELLGEHPRPLALELFDRLIARRAWRLGRIALGYSRAPITPLLKVHGGRPYVDVRASFASLLPNGLPSALGDRLVSAWLERLRRHPELHDKIEFEITVTTLTCGLDARLESHYPGHFSSADRATLRDALRGPTMRALDASSVEALMREFDATLREAPPEAEPGSLKRWLRQLELRTGAAFAAAARQAFAIEALLRSAVGAGALSASRFDEIKRAVDSAGSEFQRAWARAAERDEHREELMRRYGHQRAGTFELAAPRLVEIASDLARGPVLPAPVPTALPVLDARERAALEGALSEAGIAISAEALVAHYVRVVRAREHGKFALAYGASMTLEALAQRAQALGVGREEAGWLGLRDLLAPRADAATLHARVRAARERHAIEAQLRMPLLIADERLDTVAFMPGRPNYLGRGRAEGPPVRADARSRPDDVPPHAMLAVASADPGFDWIFLRRPAAIVTAYGGPNSHIAIRCTELGIPALLGIGPEAFRRVLAARRLMIDFDSRTWALA